MKVERSMSQITWSKTWEILLLIGTVLVVCALFLIPTIFYALPPMSLTRVPEADSPSSRSRLNQTVCEYWRNYSSEICFDELAKLQSCHGSQVAGVVHIPLDTNQEEAEATAKGLLQGLPLLSPSPECETTIRPFLCLYLFGSCNIDNQPHQVTQTDCERLRDGVCAREWALAERFLGQGVLPDCSTLHSYNQENDCQGFNNSIRNETESRNLVIITNITCADGYYLSESGVCRPFCSLWVEPLNVDSNYVAVIAAVVISLLSSAVLVVAAIVQRKTMLIFPTYYLIYLCVTTILLAMLLLIGLASKGKLFCTSYDLLETLANENAYCTFSGIVFMYGMAQLGLFVLFHAVGLCWGVVFPFHFRQFKAKEKLKYIHITTVVTALFLPLVPALLHLQEGYGVANTPTVVCFGRSVDVTFFSLILPMSAILAVATSILIFIFWIIFKLALTKLSTTVNSKYPRLKKAEAKILFIMCYYVVMGTLVLTLFTYFEATSDVEFRAVEQYFICQSAGLQSGNDCGDTPQVHLAAFSSLSTLAIILVGLLPIVVIAFTVKCERKPLEKP